MTPPPTATVTATTPRRRPTPPRRYLAIRADLLPDEIVDGRRLGVLQRRLGIALLTLVGLLIVWYGGTRYATSSAEDDLATAQSQYTHLLQQQTQYQPLISAQTGTQRIETTLRKLMAGDVQWKQMLATLRSTAPSNIKITGITGTMTAGAASANKAKAGGLGALNLTGSQEVGQLSITGTAPDKNSVARYVDALVEIKGLATPFPSSVQGTPGDLTFTVDAIITADALGGRYAGGSK